MKQQILNLKKKLLLVDLPEGAKSIEIKPHKIRNAIYEEDCFGAFSGDKLLFKYPFKIEIIGTLTDITEEQFEKWVEQYTIDKWRNYLMQSQYHEWLKPNAKESFFSYLEANEIYFSNPLGKKPSEIDIMRASWFDNPITDEDRKVWAWQEAEQKVWNLEQTYLFQIL